MRRPFDLMGPGGVAGLAVQAGIGREFAALHGLVAGFVCPSNELCFGSLEVECCLISVVDFAFQLFAVRRDPNPTDRITKHMSQFLLVFVVVWNGHEEDRSRRHPRSIGG